jgi:hypothetical protein
LTY